MNQFFINLWESVRAEEACKRREKREAAEAAADKILGPRQPPPPPSPDPLTLLEKELQAIDEAGIQDELLAQNNYLDLLARLAPARRGPAPSPDAHALAVAPTSGPPSPPEVIAVLKAAAKTREDLRKDLVTWARLRDKADLAATRPALTAALKKAREELEAEKAAFAAVEAEWAGRIAAKSRVEQEADFALTRTREALLALGDAQSISPRRRAIPIPTIMDRSRATVEELANEAEAKRLHAELEDLSLRLGFLRQVFFTPRSES